MTMVRSMVLGMLVVFASWAQATDIPVRYTVNDKVLRDAVAGTTLSFQLFTDSTCSGTAVHTEAIAVENVNVIARLKRFKAPGATAPTKTAELSQTLTGVEAAGNLYLKVTGTGVTPIGGVCQAQSGSQPAAPVVKDSTGAIVGTSGSYDGTSPFKGFVLRRIGTTTVGLMYGPLGFSVVDCVYFPAASCSGQGYTGNFQNTFPFPIGLVVGTTLYYADNSVPPSFQNFLSFTCGSGCQPTPGSNNNLVPVLSTTVPAFTPPFHVEIP